MSKKHRKPKSFHAQVFNALGIELATLYGNKRHPVSAHVRRGQDILDVSFPENDDDTLSIMVLGDELRLYHRSARWLAYDLADPQTIPRLLKLVEKLRHPRKGGRP